MLVSVLPRGLQKAVHRHLAQVALVVLSLGAPLLLAFLIMTRPPVVETDAVVRLASLPSLIQGMVRRSPSRIGDDASRTYAERAAEVTIRLRGRGEIGRQSWNESAPAALEQAVDGWRRNAPDQAARTRAAGPGFVLGSLSGRPSLSVPCVPLDTILADGSPALGAVCVGLAGPHILVLEYSGPSGSQSQLRRFFEELRPLLGG